MNRSLAAVIVGRVVRSGAYSNVLVQSETRDLESRDAGHVRFLVFGTLRHLKRIDRVIAGYSKRPGSTRRSWIYCELVRLSCSRPTRRLMPA